jgi:hypothetical protein
MSTKEQLEWARKTFQADGPLETPERNGAARILAREYLEQCDYIDRPGSFVHISCERKGETFYCIPAQIVAVEVRQAGLMYQVVWWDESHRKCEWLFPCELIFDIEPQPEDVNTVTAAFTEGPSMTVGQLISRCKCGVYLTVNQHRDYYQSASERLKELKEQREVWEELEPEIEAKMIETNTIIELHFYPRTPIGSFSIFHYDLQAALDQAEECFDACADRR